MAVVLATDEPATDEQGQALCVEAIVEEKPLARRCLVRAW